MFVIPNYEFRNEQKGYRGTVLIIGGSSLYTGAPYNVALSCLLTGSDLVYIFTRDEAILSMKVLLPEAIVCSIQYQEWILKRIDICVFGVGLGNIDDVTKEVIIKILDLLSTRGVFIIIDGDGLRNLSLLPVEKYKNIIYTPNINEAKYIEALRFKQYALYKGKHDEIKSYDKKRIIVDTIPCGKRCGGQGDILSGILAALIIKLKDVTSTENIISSMALASKILRHAGNKAFNKKRISTLQRDIIQELPEAIYELILKNNIH